MSISSISASKGVSALAAALANGYRFTATRSIIVMPCSRRRVAIGGHRAAREDAAVDHRVQRLDAAVHHLREAGDVADRHDGKTAFLQRAGRAAGGHQLESTRGKSARKFEQPALIRHAQQGSRHRQLLDSPQGHA